VKHAILGIFKREFIEGKWIGVGGVRSWEQRWWRPGLCKTSQDVCKCHCIL